MDYKTTYFDFPSADDLYEEIISENREKPEWTEASRAETRKMMMQLIKEKGEIIFVYTPISLQNAKELKSLGYVVDISKGFVHVKIL